jgi:hypothetical protein
VEIPPKQERFAGSFPELPQLLPANACSCRRILLEILSPGVRPSCIRSVCQSWYLCVREEEAGVPHPCAANVRDTKGRPQAPLAVAESKGRDSVPLATGGHRLIAREEKPILTYRTSDQQ